MSLFALPVTLTDIEKLQLGIEFQTNVPEATLEVGLINAGPPPSVYSYANQLILNMAPLSQVVMAVNSLMSGAVQSEAEMTNLTVNFVPAQLAFFNSLPAATQAGAGGAIVWDAEVTGFALTERAAFTTNFAHLNTGANAGTAGNAAFAAAVSTSIFGNTSLTNQVLSFLQSFTTFLTNNPTELTGNGIPLADLLKAADALTFGTEVGIALSNTGPGQVGATLEGYVSNALIANAEFQNGQGPTPVGVALQAVPLATPLQGFVVPTFTLTVGQDNATTGQPFDGTGAIVPASNVVINAPLAGIFGNQNTLTIGDTISLAGTGNTLNAFFAGGAIVGALTVQGVQTFNYTQGVTGSLVTLTGAGGPTAFFGPGTTSGVGLTTINVQNGAAGTLTIGAPAGGIKSLLTGTAAAPAINVENNASGTSVSVFKSAALFAGASTLVVATNNAAAGGGGTLFNVGGDDGAAGYTNWVVQDQDATTDLIFLGAHGSTAARSVTFTGANGGASGASITVVQATTAAEWASLTSVDAHLVSGAVNVTGGETGGFLSALVGSAAAVFSITLGSGAGNVADLTSWAGTAAHLSINLGSGGTAAAPNILALSSALADTTTAFGGGGLQGVQQLDDAGGVGGTVNMTFFPGVTDVTLVGAASGFGNGTLTSNWIINNAPAPAFTLNLLSPNLNGHSIGVAGVGAAGDTLTLDFGTVTNPGGTFQSSNYDNVIVNDSSAAFNTFALGGFLAEATLGNLEVTTANIGPGGGVLILGNIAVTPTTAGTQVGFDTATVLGGTFFSPIPGTFDVASTDANGVAFEVGVTNASVISAPGNVEVLMFGPDDAFLYAGDPHHNGDSVTAGGQFSVLQGTMGPVTEFLFGAAANGWTGATSGGGTTGDMLTDTAGGSTFYGDGGGDTINLGGGANTIQIGEFLTGVTQHNQAIVGAPALAFDDANTGFWGLGGAGTAAAPTPISTLFPTSGGTSADMTTVTGFTLATGGGLFHDTLNFNTGSWDGGANYPPFIGTGELAQFNAAAAMGFITSGNSTMDLITTQLQHLGDVTASVIAYGLGNVANAAGLVTALDSAAGALTTNGASAIAAGTHVLFAYASTGGDIKIADVDFLGGVAAGGNTAGAYIAASDMFDLGHTFDLLGISTHPADIAFHLLTS